MAAVGLDAPAVLLRQAMTLHRAGREEEADRLYAMVLDAEPRQAQVLRLRGILARDTGHLGLSVELLRRAAAAAEEDPEPAAELGLSHLAGGHLHLAEAAFRQALARDPASAKALANLGAVLQHQGHVIEAIAAYRGALAVTPDDIGIRCNLAQTLVEAHRGDEALGECDEALAISISHMGGQGGGQGGGQASAQADGVAMMRAMVSATRGSILCSLERYAEAQPVLEDVVESQANGLLPVGALDMPLINLALAARELGLPDHARDVLVTAVRVNPDNARAVADLALMWAGSGHGDRALDITADFLARHPGERLVLAARAVALRETGQAGEARVLIDLEGLVVIHDHLPAAGQDAAGLNEGLAALIRNDASLLASPASKAARGGTQTGELNPLREPLVGRFQALVNAGIHATVEAYRTAGLADHPVMDWAADSWTLRMWGNVLESGGHQLPHIHPLGWLSGVYYLELPAAITDANAGMHDGALEFGALPGWISHRQPPERRIITPAIGRLVVFPSFFHHRTLPFHAPGEQRISIAFDVMPARAAQLLQGG